jgi:origin recognition complex subunit 5
VKSAESITGRHLLETIVGAIAQAIGWKGNVHRCENLAQLAVEISRLLDGNSRKLDSGGEGDDIKSRFVLVLDGIDKQRDAPPTLVPALARMGEVVS